RRQGLPGPNPLSNDYRVVVFGAGGVGKSSLVLRFVKGTFRDTYIPTIEDTYRQVISCDKSVCTLQITDTTGSHQFPALHREGEAVAKEWKCAFMETSAKMNYNVKELFQELLNLEKRRNVSLTIDGKRSSKQKRTDKIKGKCSVM
ncbi:PREDICTED: GTP-binding protein Di-Ras2-like, partial [Mesitornis unicolor]|uniref:GTP-binding protein Di-Ras2-like n=1 Tax=Mesitornis unicolor TaxID=54374 RepID=UPI000528A45A